MIAPIFLQWKWKEKVDSTGNRRSARKNQEKNLRESPCFKGRIE